MVSDTLDRLGHYAGLSPLLPACMRYLQDFDPSTAEGRYHLTGIDPETVFINVERYETRPDDGALWEAHQRYVDLQFLASGRERIDVMPLESMTVTVPYDTEGDFMKGTVSAEEISQVVIGGTDDDRDAKVWSLLMPQDAHRPCVQVIPGAAEPVLKVVMKLRVDQFVTGLYTGD